MNPLFNIVKIFVTNHQVYLKYNQVINLKYLQEYYKDLYKIFKCLELYKKEHQVNGNIADFSMFFLSCYPAMKPDEVELFLSIFTRIQDSPVTVDAVVEYLEAYKQKELATQIAVKAIEVSEGRSDFGSITELMKDYAINLPEEQDDFVSSDLSEVHNNTVHRVGLRWRLDTLNKMLGSLRTGNFGFVFARPETGKTTFLASEATFMAEQADGPVLWVNNEEAGAVVMSRCYQASLGVTGNQLFADIAKNTALYKQRTGDRIKILDDANSNRRQVELICKRLRPKLIILDQIDKIKGFDADRHDLKLKDIYQWARELAKTYGPTIGTCQAGGTGENKKWLQMNDVDSSHTAKQGEADFVLGIGKVLDENYESERYLHLAKNKLPGDEDTLPKLRHGKCPVTIRPDIARYEDKLKW